MVCLVGVVVSPRTAVPMGAEQDTLLAFGMIAGQDIGALEYRAVIAAQVGLLECDVHARLPELVSNPLPTTFMGLAIHDTWSEVALLLAVLIGRIGHKCRSDRPRRRII